MKADTTRLEIPLSSLSQLPEGASFSAKKGRANVKVSFSQQGENGKPSLLVESSCDSLMTRLYQSEETNDSLMRQIDLLRKMTNRAVSDNEQHTDERQSRLEELRSFAKLIGAVIMVLASLSVLDYIIYQRKRKKQ